jgi:Uncharacterized protein conserved in bacteria (DUF2334)
MKHVILRDDDTCALTPVACLERLYRPYLDRGLPVNLATIPRVNTKATWKDGGAEGFTAFRRGDEPTHLPLAANQELLAYLDANRGFRLLHHGFEHTYLEFASRDRADLARRLDAGRRCFEDAGVKPPGTFVAPYDQLSREAFHEIAARFHTLSTGWFELRKLPPAWWPRYVVKKFRHVPHWRAGGLRLMSHPGCLLSHKHPFDTMLDRVKSAVRENEVTVLVTHWWEYFHGGAANEAYIAVLHALAEWLAERRDVRVVGFEDWATRQSAQTTRSACPIEPHTAEARP